jgi:hypothetical protein
MAYIKDACWEAPLIPASSPMRILYKIQIGLKKEHKDWHTHKRSCGLIDVYLDVLENVDIIDGFSHLNRLLILLEGSIRITDPCAEESSIQGVSQEMYLKR